MKKCPLGIRHLIGCECLIEISKAQIWMVELPLSSGHEQYGQRPCIVINQFKNNGVVLVVPLTSSINAENFAYTLSILATKTNGLEVESIALAFHLKSISISLFRKKLGKLSDEDRELLSVLLKAMVNIGLKK